MYEYNLGLRFQSIAKQYAQRTALWFSESNTVSYGELDRTANQIARLLLDLGVAPNDVICFPGKKSLFTFASMVACLKIGAIYSILDPDNPPRRLYRILSTCDPKLVISEDDDTKLEGYSDEILPQTHDITGANPAYIMFTSGSTGFPKGAVMTHDNILNLIGWSKETYGISHKDVLTNVNPLFFDNSVFDIYSALFTGACLVPFTKEEVRDPKLLVNKVDEAKCTLWFSVPSLLIFLQTMKATDGKHFRSIRRFIFGGEGYPKAKLEKLYNTYVDSAEFFNVSGPTECTCICSSYRIMRQDFQDLQGFPPLGEIARNFLFLILDDDNNKVPEGELGELCLLGPNVGKGYYNDPERTAAVFVQNPFNNEFPEIVYKTGDLVRLEGGKLYIHGRKDNQIKHMGYRIELEEIEVALHCLDYVSEAAAFYTTIDGLSRIIAVVASCGGLGDNQIRADLGQIIPDYMIPSVYHYKETLPKNPNGKIDRKALAGEYCK